MTRVTEVVTLGETMALFKASSTGALAHQNSLTLSVGGAESNCAIALQRLGTSVTWVGRVGADSLGELVLKELRGEGIQVLARADTDAPTGLMIKERRTADAIRVWYYRSGSAGSRLSTSDVPQELIAEAKVLHITGITPALSDSADAAVELAVSCARSAGTLVSFDFNYRSALWDPTVAGDKFRRLAEQSDLVFAGHQEASLVVGQGSPAEQARRLADLGPRHVVIKLGDRGSVAVIDGDYLEQAAIPVRVSDAVGAGDAFVGGYLSEFLEGALPRQCLETASKVGAFACTVEGDWEGSPRREDLDLLTTDEPVTR